MKVVVQSGDLITREDIEELFKTLPQQIAMDIETFYCLCRLIRVTEPMKKTHPVFGNTFGLSVPTNVRHS